MRIVLQRVSEARVEVEDRVVGRIGRGVLLLVGVGRGDRADDAVWLARKIANLRVFPDRDGKMNLSLRDIQGACLAVSQFTLYGNCRKGTRPGFADAAPPDEGERGYETFVHCLRDEGVPVETGQFRAMMDVHLVNDGPVTLLLERGGDTA